MPKPPREIPWLEQRNGVYNVRWYEPPTAEQKQRNPQAKGETKRLGLRTRDAGEAAARFAAFLATGYHKTTAAGRLTVAGALEQYLDEHVEHKVVAKRRAYNVSEHLIAFFGTTPIAAIGVPECRAYTKSRTGAGVTGSTARRELTALRAAARHALRWKRITLDQMPTFEMPAEFDDGQEARWYTKEEVALLLARAEGRLRDFIVLAYGWGARRASVESLEARQVQLDKGVVNLQKPGQQITKKRRPIVPIYASQRETLERLVATTQDGFLFGRGYYSYRPFQVLCEACGIDEDRRHPHILRHSRATHMLMDGQPLLKVGGLLGDKITTVARVYAHHSTEWMAEEEIS